MLSGKMRQAPLLCCSCCMLAGMLFHAKSGCCYWLAGMLFHARSGCCCMLAGMLFHAKSECCCMLAGMLFHAKSGYCCRLAGMLFHARSGCCRMLVVGQSLQFFQLGSTLLAENLAGHDRVSLYAGGVEQPVTGSTAQVFARKKKIKNYFLYRDDVLTFLQRIPFF